MLMSRSDALQRNCLKRFILFGLIVTFMLLQGCSSSSKSTISIPSSSFTALSLDKPITLDNGKMKITIPEVINNGEKFGLNGSLSNEQKGKYYCLRLKLLVENVSNSPVEFGDTTIIA
jgi:hypothetical protein